jgi:hypothetical protein
VKASDMDQQPVELNRRQALRAGAVVAGSLWVVPAVTVIGVGPASADAASGFVPPPPIVPTTTNTTTSTTTGTTTSTIAPTVSGTKHTSQPTVSGDKFTKPPADVGAASVLPRTGAEIIGLTAVGGGLVAAGVALRKAATASDGTHRRGRPDDDLSE